MSTMASQITSLTIVYSTVYSGTDQRKHQSFASLTFLQGIHRWPVNSPHIGPVTHKVFPFDEVIIPNPLFMSHTHLTIYLHSGKVMSVLCNFISWNYLLCVYILKYQHRLITKDPIHLKCTMIYILALLFNIVSNFQISLGFMVQ